MIDFKPIQLSDKPWIERHLHSQNTNSADRSFASVYMWAKAFSQEAAEQGGRLLVRINYQNKSFYAFPIGGGSLSAAIESLRQDAKDRGMPFSMRGVLAAEIAELSALFPEKFDSRPLPHTFDYVYSAESLQNLSGRKLHGKRNHIHRFERENLWEFESIGPHNLEKCEKMAKNWFRQNEVGREAEYENEKMALERAFRNFSELGLEGGLLQVDGEPIAFTIGERLNRDTYVIRFEKAYSHVEGAYPMINREFAREIGKKHPDILYINREEDMGIENLKRAKRSYCPLFMVEKYLVLWK